MCVGVILLEQSAHIYIVILIVSPLLKEFLRISGLDFDFIPRLYCGKMLLKVFEIFNKIINKFDIFSRLLLIIVHTDDTISVVFWLNKSLYFI